MECIRMNITTMRNGKYSVEIRKASDGYSLFKFIIDRSGDIVMVDELHCLSWDDAHSRALDYINGELSYDIVANNAVLAAFIDDGCSGHKRKINLSLVNGVWYEVTETGYYKAPKMWSDRYSDIHQIHDGQTL